MKTTAVIYPVGGFRDLVLQGSYHDKEKNIMVCLLENGELREHAIEKQEDLVKMPMFQRIKFTTLEPVKKISFEADPSKQKAIDNINKRRIEFWSNHPQVTVDGKTHKNTVSADYNIEISSAKTLKQAVEMKNKGAVYNRINNMTLAEKRNVSFYFLQSPVGKTDLELFLSLADFNSGLCMQPGKIDEFIKVFGQAIDPDTEINIIARKAIKYSVIQDNAKEGKSNYYLGQTFIGTTFEDVLAFCKKEEILYKENIQREVSKLDRFVDEEEASGFENAHVVHGSIMTGSGKVMKSNVPTSFEIQAEFQDLKIRAKELKIPSWHVMGYDKLKNAVLNEEMKGAEA